MKKTSAVKDFQEYFASNKAQSNSRGQSEQKKEPKKKIKSSQVKKKTQPLQSNNENNQISQISQQQVPQVEKKKSLNDTSLLHTDPEDTKQEITIEKKASEKKEKEVDQSVKEESMSHQHNNVKKKINHNIQSVDSIHLQNQLSSEQLIAQKDIEKDEKHKRNVSRNSDQKKHDTIQSLTNHPSESKSPEKKSPVRMSIKNQHPVSTNSVSKSKSSFDQMFEMKEITQKLQQQINTMQELFNKKLQKMKQKNKMLESQLSNISKANLSSHRINSETQNHNQNQQSQRETLVNTQEFTQEIQSPTRNVEMKNQQSELGSYQSQTELTQKISKLSKDDQLKFLTSMVVRLSSQVNEMQTQQRQSPGHHSLSDSRIQQPTYEVETASTVEPNQKKIAKKIIMNKRRINSHFMSQQLNYHTLNHSGRDDELLNIQDLNANNTLKYQLQSVNEGTYNSHLHGNFSANISQKEIQDPHELFYQELHDELFAEKFYKLNFRDFSKNTRLNINNVGYSAQKEKRDRALKYWKSRVIQNFLPPIDQKKRAELNERILRLKHQVAPKSDLLKKHQFIQKQIRLSSTSNKRLEPLSLEYKNEVLQISQSKETPAVKVGIDQHQSLSQTTKYHNGKKFKLMPLNEFDSFNDDELQNNLVVQ